MSKQILIDHLNEDLAREVTAVCQYVQYAAMVQGASRPDLRTFFQAEIADEIMHVQYLADRVAALGGTPNLMPAPVPAADTAGDMLRALLTAEEEAIAEYIHRLGEAEAAGEIGLKVQLENMIAEEAGHRDELRQMLARWQ